MNKKNLCYIGLTLALLQGCVSNQHNTTLTPQSAINHFAADGKIALRFPRCDEYRGCKEEAFSATLHWLHKENLDELSLYDPTGQEALKISYQNQHILLEDKQGTRSLSPAQLTQELGVPLPIEKLQHWLLTQRDNATFNEEGWQIELEQWQGQYYRRLTLRQDAYYLRILVNHIAAF